MGHDIEVVVDNQVVENLYITGNFYTLYKSHGGVYYFDGIYEFHGHTGKTIARMIRFTFLKASVCNYSVGVPDPNNPNWYWGVKDGKRLPDKEFIGVYLYHMEGFLEVAEKYPTGRFYSDQVFAITAYEDDGGEDDDNDEDEGYKSEGEERERNEDLEST